MKEILKSDSICQSYAQMKRVQFFWLTVYYYFLLTSFSLPFSELSLVGLALDVVEYHSSSALWHCWLDHVTRKIVSQTTTGYTIPIPSTGFNQQGCAEFLSRVSTLTRDIDIAILSVCLSVRPSVCLWRSGIRWKRLNILSVFLPYGSPIILVLSASNIFTKFRQGHPCGVINTGGV